MSKKEKSIEEQIKELEQKTYDLQTVLIWVMQETKTHEKFKEWLNVPVENQNSR